MQTDFIVMSCDLIIGIPSTSILNFHRIHEPAVTALFVETMKPDPSDPIIKNKDECTLFQ